MHAYEQWIGRRYFCNLISSREFQRATEVDQDVVEWVKAHGEAYDLPKIESALDGHVDGAGKVKKWHAWRRQALEGMAISAPKPSNLERRLRQLGDCCALEPGSRGFFGLLARATKIVALRELIATSDAPWSFGASDPTFDVDQVRALLPVDVPLADIDENENLLRFGLVTKVNAGRYRLSETVGKLLSAEKLNAETVGRLLLGPERTASLAWEDFDHLGTVRDLACRLLSSECEGGVNILLHGPPGTGKSEFAKTLGARVGLPVHFAGERDGHFEPDRRERVAALVIANELGKSIRDVVVVVDEADDLFIGVDAAEASARRGSKLFMNRLVEKTKVPTIWITNDIDRLGPAVVRRMDLVLAFPRPNATVRKSMVARIAARRAFDLDDGMVARLAHFPAPPALVDTAIRSAARMNGNGEDAVRVLATGLKALGIATPSACETPIAFDPALCRADVDLVDLTARLRAQPSRALSFCLSGPSGTGKSAYARHLASVLGMEVLERRYSDLASPFVGETERAIATAFEEASEQGAFLIIDEADSLLRDRRIATQSWEVTQVNELLVQMERHVLPFACTTNAVDSLDVATARRFLFKIDFLPMDPARAEIAFRRMFGSEPPRGLSALDGPTPGDFSVVARKAAILGTTDPAQLVDWLAREIDARAGRRPLPIGFVRPGRTFNTGSATQ